MRNIGRITALLIMLLLMMVPMMVHASITGATLDCATNTVTVTFNNNGSDVVFLNVTGSSGGGGSASDGAGNEEISATLSGVTPGSTLQIAIFLTGGGPPSVEAIPDGTTTLPYDCVEGAGGGSTTRVLFVDGRVCWDRDFAVFTPQDAGIRVYRTQGRFGTLQLDAPPSLLSTLPEFPAQNTLIVQQGGYALYKLTTGQYQVNIGPDFEGKVFVCRWRNLPADRAEFTTFFDR